MSIVTLRPGVEVKLRAAEAARLFLDPVEETARVTTAPEGFQRDQVIDVDELAPSEAVTLSEARD